MNSCVVARRKTVIKSSQRLVILVQSDAYADTCRQKCHGLTRGITMFCGLAKSPSAGIKRWVRKFSFQLEKKSAPRLLHFREVFICVRLRLRCWLRSSRHDFYSKMSTFLSEFLRSKGLAQGLGHGIGILVVLQNAGPICRKSQVNCTVRTLIIHVPLLQVLFIYRPVCTCF